MLRLIVIALITFSSASAFAEKSPDSVYDLSSASGQQKIRLSLVQDGVFSRPDVKAEYCRDASGCITLVPYSKNFFSTVSTSGENSGIFALKAIAKILASFTIHVAGTASIGGGAFACYMAYKMQRAANLAGVSYTKKTNMKIFALGGVAAALGAGVLYALNHYIEPYLFSKDKPADSVIEGTIRKMADDFSHHDQRLTDLTPHLTLRDIVQRLAELFPDSPVAKDPSILAQITNEGI